MGAAGGHGRELRVAKKSKRKLRQPEGLMNEMNLLLASLRRVEVRIEPQRIGDFLKWKNRMASYNGGALPEGIVAAERGREFAPGCRCVRAIRDGMRHLSTHG